MSIIILRPFCFANGVEEEFDSDGTLDLSQTRANGTIEGLFTENHTKGQVSYLANYAEGMIYGRAFMYDQDGRLTECEDYEDGELVDSFSACVD